MRNNALTFFATTALIAVTSPAFAQDNSAHGHGGAAYHAVRLEADIGRKKDEVTATWDVDGWYGNAYDKLWVKSEGELSDGRVQSADAWVLYSRNIAIYWDGQAGLRQDARPDIPGGKAHTYLVTGVKGLAPYFFETEAHVFLRDDGALSARLRQENEWRVTNRFILRPWFEINVSANEDVRNRIGNGITDATLGLQARYEFSRAFAPYVDLAHKRRVGRTADIVRAVNEPVAETRLSTGLRYLF